MANYDVKVDATPNLANQPVGYLPSVSALRTAISGSAVSASYPAAFLDGATKNDLVAIARTHNISVTGL